MFGFELREGRDLASGSLLIINSISYFDLSTLSYNFVTSGKLLISNVRNLKKNYFQGLISSPGHFDYCVIVFVH